MVVARHVPLLVQLTLTGDMTTNIFVSS
jgi:hypothetical protein